MQSSNVPSLVLSDCKQSSTNSKSGCKKGTIRSEPKFPAGHFERRYAFSHRVRNEESIRNLLIVSAASDKTQNLFLSGRKLHLIIHSHILLQ